MPIRSASARAAWHSLRDDPALDAALRAYGRQATPDDEALLAREMAAFVAHVRSRLAERA